MRVIYNGVDLGVSETHEYTCETVMDDSGTDYLYTRILVVVRAVVNGQAEVVTARAPGPFVSYARSGTTSGLGAPVSDTPPGQNPRTPFPPLTPTIAVPGPTIPTIPRGNDYIPVGTGFDPPAPGSGRRAALAPIGDGLTAGRTGVLRDIVVAPNQPPLTVDVVMHRLTTPRAPLYVFTGPFSGPAAQTTIMLESPALDPTFPPATPTRMACDCKNGPVPRLLGITAVHGDANTFMVDFAVETYVNQSLQNSTRGLTYNPTTDPMAALLSNRFSQRHTVNEAGYTTVVTGGVAIFRTDLVYALANNPDAIRGALFMPIPQGFVRDMIDVNGMPDVTGVGYSYADRQVAVNFPAARFVKAASMSAVHRQAITSNPDLFGGALAAYERILGIGANKNIRDSGRGGDGSEREIARRLQRMLGRTGVRRPVQPSNTQVAPGA